MSRRTSRLYLFSCLVVSASLLTASLTGNPWAPLVPGVLFMFVLFPRQRGWLERLLDKLIAGMGKLAGRGHDPDPQ